MDKLSIIASYLWLAFQGWLLYMAVCIVLWCVAGVMVWAMDEKTWAGSIDRGYWPVVLFIRVPTVALLLLMALLLATFPFSLPGLVFGLEWLME